MEEKKIVPIGLQIAYASGMAGWSIMINLISVILVYMYAPTENSGIPTFITQAAIFGIFNAIALITAGGRLVDAFYDPFIAQYSDKSTHPKGRRIPLMKKAIIPSLIACFFVFFPISSGENTLNIVWLTFLLIVFYVASTTYIIPYNALLPELAPSSKDKVRLATFQSVGYVFGIGIASNAFNLVAYCQDSFGLSKVNAIQVTVLFFALIGAIAMYVTVFAIDEKKWCNSQPSHIDMKIALRQTLTNKNFLLFIVADFSYFIAVTIITSGLIYFVTVLLQLEESIGNKLMITMVLVSFLFYPIVNWLAAKIGKKIIVLFSLALLSFIFLGVYSLGKWSLAPEVQIFGLIAIAAIPLASLNILPNAILAEIITKDSLESGVNKEAIYFAVRYFFVKIAQTIGIALFAMFLLYGKDVGDDFGIRLNGLLGFGLCFVATIIFFWFKEDKEFKK